MKRILFPSIMFMLSCFCAVAQSDIRASLSELMNDRIFVEGDASIAIYDLSGDECVFEYRSGKSVRPASVMKLLTSIAAYDTLGLCYTMETTLSEVSDEKGYCLYVKGEMDPLFGEDDMIAMAASVPAGSVVDTLFADCSFCDSLYWGPGWSWDDNPYAYQPYLSPLMYCGGGVEVVVWPSENGEAPYCKVTPESSFYTVVNDAVCGDTARGKLTILRDWLNDSNVIRITGNCTAEKKEGINMYKSADFFLAVLVEQLDSMGVDVKNGSFRRTPLNAVSLHTSRRLVEDVINEALVQSDNLCAESLLYHLAASVSHEPASMKRGCEAVKFFVENKLGHRSGFNIADGSGLSLYNYLTADILVSLLRYAYSIPDIYYQIYPRLSLSGFNGTLKHRMKGTAAYGKVYAKTGTLKGVCTLCGYANGRNGHVYAFVLLNNGNMDSKEVRKWQDKVLDILCR